MADGTVDRGAGHREVGRPGVRRRDEGPLAQRRADVLADLDHRRRELAELRDRLAHLSATATTTHRDISVTVDARGQLIDLRIEPAALRQRSADALADTIVHLSGEADAQLASARERILDALADESRSRADSARR